MAINPNIARVLSPVYGVPEEDVEAVMAVNAELARESIDAGLAAMDAEVGVPAVPLQPNEAKER